MEGEKDMTEMRLWSCFFCSFFFHTEGSLTRFSPHPSLPFSPLSGA